jgi:hypothetical protein
MDTGNPDILLTTWLKTWIKQRFQYRPVVHGLGFVQRSKTPSKPMGWEVGEAQARLEHLTKFSNAVTRASTNTVPDDIIAAVGHGPFTDDEAVQLISSCLARRSPGSKARVTLAGLRPQEVDDE